MLRIGLTGGIGSGKSTVSARMAELGAVVIDYDRLAREAVEPGTSALAAITERFGREILHETGELNRPALGALVFADPDALKDLEAITHPAIRDLALSRDAAAGTDRVVVHDHPLLVEMGMKLPCEAIIVVDLPTELQIERLVTFRGMSSDEALARIAAQTSREARLAVADIVLDNSGSVDELLDQVDAVWKRLTTSA